jgi:hypothetical protein
MRLFSVSKIHVIALLKSQTSEFWVNVSKEYIRKANHKMEQTFEHCGTTRRILKGPIFPSNWKSLFALFPTDARLFTHCQLSSLLHFQTKATTTVQAQRHNFLQNPYSFYSTTSHHVSSTPPYRNMAIRWGNLSGYT